MSCMHIFVYAYIYTSYASSLISRPRPKIGRGLGTGHVCTQYALRSGELWSACDIVFCVHLGWEDVIVHEQYLQNNNSFSNKIQNPLLNVEIHFEIQKSTLKSWNPLWNPEIHFEILKSALKSCNPLWNPEIQKSQKSNLKSEIHVDFEISYAEMRRGGPLAPGDSLCSPILRAEVTWHVAVSRCANQYPRELIQEVRMPISRALAL